MRRESGAFTMENVMWEMKAGHIGKRSWRAGCARWCAVKVVTRGRKHEKCDIYHYVCGRKRVRKRRFCREKELRCYEETGIGKLKRLNEVRRWLQMWFKTLKTGSHVERTKLGESENTVRTKHRWNSTNIEGHVYRGIMTRTVIQHNAFVLLCYQWIDLDSLCRIKVILLALTTRTNCWTHGNRNMKFRLSERLPPQWISIAFACLAWAAELYDETR